MGGFHSFYDQTQLHPLGLIAVLGLGVVLLFVPRQYAILPIVVLACFIPQAQRLVVMGMDFSLLRIMVIFAWLRLILRNEFGGFVWNRLDSLVLAWMLSCTLIYTLQQGTQSAFVNRAGWMFEGCGMYYFFRSALRDWIDFERLILGFLLLSIPVATAFAIESLTGRNAFSIFGGVSAVTIERDGRLRCQGAFDHAILAGCFWASVIPWMIASFVSGKKWMGGVGILASIFIIIACASSTPVMGLIFVAIGMAFFPLRAHLRYFWWGFVCTLVFLHMIMNQPVWHLLARANVVGGSTGWHRFMIMDATVDNFSKWWLLGERDPMSWGVWEMRDITNQYILEALRGGLLTLTLFVAGIVVAFKSLGQALKRFESNPNQRILIWTVGVSLFVHVWAYLAVSYFGQIVMLWYLNLAMVGSIVGICATDDSKVTQTSIHKGDGSFAKPRSW